MSLDDKMGLPANVPQQKSLEVTPEDISADNDYDEIRLNLKEVVDVLREQTLPELLDVARASQRADHYRAVSDVAKSIIEASRTLMDLNTKKVEITGVKPTQPINQNVLVVGSTAELLDIIRNAKKGKVPVKVIDHEPSDV